MKVGVLMYCTKNNNLKKCIKIYAEKEEWIQSFENKVQEYTENRGFFTYQL
jgi:hypothetical protein